MKHIHLDLAKVTEAAAIAAAEYVGSGDKISADLAATKAMKDRLDKTAFHGFVVIGEGKKDNAPGLFCGEEVGLPNWRTEYAWQYDIAVDPVEGTRAVAEGRPEAMSVIAVGRRGSLFSSEVFYMNKLAVGPAISEWDICIRDPLPQIVKQISLATNKPNEKITFCLLDRPRHAFLVEEIRGLGCRIKFISDCDVSGVIATCIPESGIDAYIGIGGTPEGVISAAALKCMKGSFQGMLCDKDGNLVDKKIYSVEDLAKGDVAFCATGITDGSLLKGVRYPNGKPNTCSILMRSESGTVRKMETQHGN